MVEFRKSAALAVLSLGLTGCTVTPVVPAPPPPPQFGPQRCDVAAVGWAVGRRASADVVERATLAAGARTARVLEPGEVTTMEFDARRLTILVNDAGRIADLRCG